MENKKIEEKEIEKEVEEFFRKRFPDNDIEFEKECGYFGEWVERFESGEPELHMDGVSKRVYAEMLRDKANRIHPNFTPEEECPKCGHIENECECDENGEAK